MATQVSAVGRKGRVIEAGVGFDWLAMVSLLWIIVGVGVDGNAHFHGLTDNTFFTPWHAILYSGVVVAGIVHIGVTVYNRGLGCTWEEAIPRGYRYALIGVAVGGVAGILDMLYHIAFGIEANIEGLTSPTHMLIMVALG